ncbi:GLPGLI family protein [Marinifilum sp.]|uniref:GLPGLI family protein n=1 Tax=Marinifilum sp. TaxID=2033137 RepID=UPI003BAAF380
MKKISQILLLVLMSISASLSAQEKELYIQYDYHRNFIFNIEDELTDNKKANDLNKSIKATSSSRPPKKVEVFSHGGVIISKEYSSRIGSPSNIVNGKIVGDDFEWFCNYVKKDYSQNILLETIEGTIPRHEFVLKEHLNLFNWTPGKETREILGYNCNKATCTFRGRDYVAWFTRDIPFKAAPWKIHGLPGVILEVFTTDNLVKWTAKELKIRPQQAMVETPFKDLKTLDIKEYKEFIQKKEQRSIEMHKRFVLEHTGDPKATIRKHVPQLNSLEKFELNLKE